MSRRNSVPNGWNKYKSMKDVIEGTRFLPFKTPLNMNCERRFTTTDLLSRVGNLGFVLNLVKTNRYYNTAIYGYRKIDFLHKFFDGAGKLPTHDEIQTVFKKMDEFIRNNKDDEAKLIGVHCTHGVNRTGYVICRYMIEKLGIEPKVAIDRFEAGRGHRFDHAEYPEDLCRLEPTVDREALAWHSIGGKIQKSVIEDEELDIEAVKRRGRRASEPSENASADDSRHARNSPPRSYGYRREYADEDRSYSRRQSSSSSSRSRREDRSRSPLRYSTSDAAGYHQQDRSRHQQSDRTRYQQPEWRVEVSERSHRYLGPRESGGRHHWPEKFAGPRREESREY